MNMHPGPQLGSGRLDAVQGLGPATLTDTTGACLFLQWMNTSVRGDKQDVQRKQATVTIDADGATDSKLLITLTIERQNFLGDAIADLTYVISGAAAKVDWSDVSASDTASAVVLKDVMDLINQIDGFKCWVKDAPHAMSVNSGTFIDLAETTIQSGTSANDYQTILHRDVSAFAVGSKQVLWYRIGLPEVRDANALRLLKIFGTCTGVANGLLKLYRDNYTEYGSTAEVYVEKTLAAALTEYVDRDLLNASTIRGPVLLEVAADDLTVASYRAEIMQASLGA